MIHLLKITDNYRNSIMATVSHELRTPLNCIISMLDMLRMNIDEELSNKFLLPATNSSKLLLCMINDIIDFGQICAKMHQHYYDTFSLKEALQETLALFEIPAKSRNIGLKLDWDPKIPSIIYSDPSRICQIVTNLLGNAIKFTYKGSITLKAVSKSAQTIRIMVLDTGVGIKTDEVRMLFKAFGNLEHEQFHNQGVGIGLKIAQSLAYRLGPKEHRGIKVQSEFGKGSCFFFTIESRMKHRRVPTGIKDYTEELSSRDGNRITRSPLHTQEERKQQIEENKDHVVEEICEIEETSGEETMRLESNLGTIAFDARSRRRKVEKNSCI